MVWGCGGISGEGWKADRLIFGTVSAMCWLRVGCVLRIFWGCVGDVLVKFQLCVGDACPVMLVP